MAFILNDVMILNEPIKIVNNVKIILNDVSMTFK